MKEISCLSSMPYQQLGSKKVMTASKSWGDCGCGCGGTIKEGKKFQIDSGLFFLEGHLDNPVKKDFVAVTEEPMQIAISVEDAKKEIAVEIIQKRPRGRPKKLVTVEQIESKLKEKEDVKKKWFI